MVTKRIKARQDPRHVTRERIAHARSLIEYLFDPERVSEEKAYMVDYMLREGLADTSGERLLHVGHRNLFSDTDHSRKIEMMALANAATRSPNPVDHWLLSWQEEEHPEPGQVDGAVEMFLGHLGLGKQPALYVLHGDTNNHHCHIAVNRYNVSTERMIEINHGFNKEAAHQAVAMIVDHFGWQPEEKQRYAVVDGKIVLSKRVQKQKMGGLKTIREGAAAVEWRTGYKSAQRIAQEEAVPIILKAQSWTDLHERLAAKGMTYERVGTNGIVIGVGDDHLKASSVHARITLSHREKSLGEFIARDPSVEVRARATEEDRFPEAVRADEYRAQREAYRASRDRKKKLDALRQQRVKMAQTATELAGKAFLERVKPEPEPDVSRPPPSLEAFLYSKSEGKLAARYCRRKSADLAPTLTGQKTIEVHHQPIGDFNPYRFGDEIRYARSDKAPPVFVDKGDRVDVMATEDAEAIVAALQLAAVKFQGRISVNGSSEFRERVFQIAQSKALGNLLVDGDFVQRRAADQLKHYRVMSSSGSAPFEAKEPEKRSVSDDLLPLLKGDQRQSEIELVTVELPKIASLPGLPAPRRNEPLTADNEHIPEKARSPNEAKRSTTGDAAARADEPKLVRSKGLQVTSELPIMPSKGLER